MQQLACQPKPAAKVNNSGGNDKRLPRAAAVGLFFAMRL